MKYLVDTNVLLRWSDSLAPEYEQCQEAVSIINEQGGETFVCTQTLIEYYVVATRSRSVNGLGLSAADAYRNVVDILGVLACLSEPPDIAQRWLDLVHTHSVLGKQAHDARLAALMLSHGITQLLTLNPTDFARYSEITSITPAEVLTETSKGD